MKPILIRGRRTGKEILIQVPYDMDMMNVRKILQGTNTQLVRVGYKNQSVRSLKGEMMKLSKRVSVMCKELVEAQDEITRFVDEHPKIMKVWADLLSHKDQLTGILKEEVRKLSVEGETIQVIENDEIHIEVQGRCRPVVYHYLQAVERLSTRALNEVRALEIDGERFEKACVAGIIDDDDAQVIRDVGKLPTPAVVIRFQRMT